MRLFRLAISALALLAACDPSQPPVRAATMPAVPFDSAYRLADTITPEQPDSLPIGLISGIDFAADGSFVIADVRGAQLMRYARDGRLMGRMGRHGFGPGEFQAAMFPVIDARGRVHALDLQQPRINVFNVDGSVLRTVPTRHIGPRVGDIEVLPDGDYLLVAWGGDEPNLLFRTDSLGAVKASYVPHARLVPEGQPARPIWGNARNASLAVAGDTALVVTSLSDSVWMVNLRTGSTSVLRITPPGYVPPMAPRGSLSAEGAYSRWADSWTTTSLVRASRSDVAVTFVHGIVMRGDPAVIAHRAADASWRSLSDGPILLAVRGDTLLSLLDPDADTLRFGVHVRR